LYHLLLALALVVRVGCLPLERSSGLRAILNEIGLVMKLAYLSLY
jgi:hypothetical protein